MTNPYRNKNLTLVLVMLVVARVDANHGAKLVVNFSCHLQTMLEKFRATGGTPHLVNQRFCGAYISD